jgi:hypothetical protein
MKPTCWPLRGRLQAKSSAEIHIYARGGHGFSFKKKNLPVDGWVDRLDDWMNDRGLLKATR